MAGRSLFSALALLFAVVPITGCIRPQYYRLGQPPAQLTFSADDKRYGVGYFRTGLASEAYVEFDARGALYRDQDGNSVQLDQALELIRRCRFRPVEDSRSCPDAKDPLSNKAKPILLYIFVHGWKNNASDGSDNPWGFRRFLSYASYLNPLTPVVGIYMGWPGASLKGDLFLSFWSREPIADVVGNSGDFQLALKRLLHEGKGTVDPTLKAGADSLAGPLTYTCSTPSMAVVIGHSFGGIVLEHAATALLQETFDAAAPNPQGDGTVEIHPPADLFVLINEAGAASLAKPFIDRLKSSGLAYTCKYSSTGAARPCPLILSMTSEGDLATKFAYPAGEFLSFNRGPTVQHPIDQWGQSSDLPYNLITAANFIALQSHSIDQVPANQTSACIVTVEFPLNNPYCIHSLRDPNDPESLKQHPNDTPYWLMQLPQIFVPDHSTVFQDTFLELLNKVASAQSATLTVNAQKFSDLQSR